MPGFSDILNKTSAANRTEAATHAGRHGLLSEEDSASIVSRDTEAKTVCRLCSRHLDGVGLPAILLASISHFRLSTNATGEGRDFMCHNAVSDEEPTDKKERSDL